MKLVNYILTLLVVISVVCMFYVFDSKISLLEYEIEQKEKLYKDELEEIKKKQRITAQDVDFLEKMIKDEL